MQLDENWYSCEWCGTGFGRRHRRGRRPLYCGRACRQRAYEERRRGAWFAGLPRPVVADPRHPGRPEYQAGTGKPTLTGRWSGSRLIHALRPDGGANELGERPSLCGAAVAPLPSNFFPGHAPTGERNCRTCADIATRFPPTHRVTPLRDVGSLTALIKPLRAARRGPVDALRREVDTLLSYFGAPGGAAFQLGPRRAPVEHRHRNDTYTSCNSPNTSMM